MKLTPVLRDEEIVRAAEGGFKRDHAPQPGFQWETDEDTGFVSRKDIETALVDLKLLQRSGRRRGR